MKREDVKDLEKRLKEKSAEEVLRYSLRLFSTQPLSHPSKQEKPGPTGPLPKDRIALASSLGAEDQVLTHMILGIEPDARIFVLDTGRFHQETYDLMAATMKRYDMRYEILFPEASDVEAMEGTHGPNLFYASVEQRKMCCGVRKIKSLRRVLSTLDAWITGLRKEQSITRSDISKVEWDEANGLVKINPLADWSEKEVWDYIKAQDIPYNRLHDEGYPSIGCAPCTRAILAGEDVRAGRWWWETPEQKECGLHAVEGKLVRGKG